MATIIERTDQFMIHSHGNGAAYEFFNLKSGESIFIQYGDEAEQFREDYENMQNAYRNPESVWYKRTWNQCLANLYSEQIFS